MVDRGRVGRIGPWTCAFRRDLLRRGDSAEDGWVRARARLGGGLGLPHGRRFRAPRTHATRGARPQAGLPPPPKPRATPACSKGDTHRARRLVAKQLGAIYRDVKLDTQLPRMATKEELRGFGEPVVVFASEQDPFFPGDAVVTRAREIVPNLVAAECIRGCRHIPTKAALEHTNEEILIFLKRHGGRSLG